MSANQGEAARRLAPQAERLMGDRPLLITQRQVKAICVGARKAGFAPVIEIGNIRIRLLPEDAAYAPETDEEKPKEYDKDFRL